MRPPPFGLTSCPETGLPITWRPEWTDVPLTARYAATFGLIGDHILFSAPRGNAGKEGMPRFLDLRERVLREADLWHQPHVEIKSYEGLFPLHSTVSRRQFLDGMLTEVPRGKLRGFWGFEGHPSIRGIMLLGKYRAVGASPPIPFDMVSDYRSAILAARTELERQEVTPLSWVAGEMRGWNVKEGHASARYRLIAPDVIHSEILGSVDAHFIEEDVALLDKICDETGLPQDRPFYHIRDLSRGTIPERRERQIIVKQMSHLMRRRAYGGAVLFGLSGLPARFFVYATRSLELGTLLQTTSFREATEAVDKLRKTSQKRKFIKKLRQRIPHLSSRRQTEHHVDELMTTIDKITWDEQTSTSSPLEIAEDNPFQNVHAAIHILALDFEQLLKRNAAAQTQLIHAAKLASLGTLTAGLAHELNSPLMAVSGYAQRLARSEDPTVRDEAASILRAASRMRTIIGRFGPGEARPAGPRHVFDLQTCITNDVIPLLAPLLEDHRINLETTQPETPVNLWGNPSEIQSVLVNILTNACHALAELPPEQPRRIHLTMEETSDHIEIVCHDNGPGMSAEVRQRAMDPFFTTKDVGDGSGLGLYLAHRFVEDHGGILQLAETNRGCRVILRLPATKGEHPPEATPEVSTKS
ncbi:MAG: HAMP domain-containing histidine kinase [Deltaproteobacteria bacterium]|nr:HAMP domain-containing histidine kinase [Deltaproteobacteria bacterium]